MFSTRSGSPRAPATDPGWREARLLLCAHGIQGQVGVAADHAEAIARLDEFAEVESCCLNGRPSLEEALERSAGTLTYVVPLLMAEGYTNEKLSERLRDAGRHHGGHIRLCRPVGSHPDLAELMIEAAGRTCRGLAWPINETALLIVGHGTVRNPRSSDSMEGHAQRIAADSRFQVVGCAFLDQEPHMAAALTEMTSDRVVAVGHFADSGPHGADDVARLLAEQSLATAYAGPIGRDPGLVSLILDRVRQEDAAVLAA